MNPWLIPDGWDKTEVPCASFWDSSLKRMLKPSCYGLTICVHPMSVCWNLNTQCDAIRRWLDNESIAFMNEINSLVKETPQSSPPLMQCENMARGQRSTTWTRAGSPPCRHLDFGLPASRTVWNKCLSFTRHPPSDTLVQQPGWTKTIPTVIFSSLLPFCHLDYEFGIWI